MTPTQVEYWKLQETKRANRASEAQKKGELAETTRSNKAREGQNYLSYQETVRHNTAGEDIDLSKLSETERHNEQTEIEANRHNVAQEDEAKRHNERQEDIDVDRITYQYWDSDWKKWQGWGNTFANNVGALAKYVPLVP